MVLDRPHLDGTAELVCRARARHVDGVFQGRGLDDQAAGHQILRFFWLGWARRQAMRAIMAHKIMASWLAGSRS